MFVCCLPSPPLFLGHLIYCSYLGQLETAGQNLLAEKEKLRIYMEKARTVIDDVEKQNRAVEAGGLSRHEFDAIRHDRDSYKQMVCFRSCSGLMLVSTSKFP